MATFTSNNYEGRYLQLVISETINPKDNTSTLNWTLSSIGGSVNYYSIAPTTATINGTTVYSKGATSWSTQVFPAAKGSTSGSITVAHNADGTKSISVGFSTRVYYSGGKRVRRHNDAYKNRPGGSDRFCFHLGHNRVEHNGKGNRLDHLRQVGLFDEQRLVLG